MARRNKNVDLTKTFGHMKNPCAEILLPMDESRRAYKVSKEIAGAIDLWFKEELSQFTRHHLKFSRTSHQAGYTIETNTDFCEDRRWGTLALGQYEIRATCWDLNIDWIIQYCDPKLFDQIRRFVMRIYNG